MNTNLFSLVKKNAIIVGGAGDLGFAILEGFLEAGASVVCIDKDLKGKEKIESLTLNSKVFFLEADISDENQITSSIKKSKDLLSGNIDILVNSQGIQRRASSENFLKKDWDDIISINLTSAFDYCQKVGSEMLEQGYGKIINIASMQSFLGGITIPAYAASKGGIAQLTKALSNDWAAKGITVNGIAPGYMNTQLNTNLVNDPVRNKEILSRIPLQRWGNPEDLKGCAVFLASDASKYVTGSIIPVDGGFLAR